MSIIRATYFIKWFSNHQYKTKSQSMDCESMNALRILIITQLTKEKIWLKVKNNLVVFQSSFITLTPKETNKPWKKKRTRTNEKPY